MINKSRMDLCACVFMRVYVFETRPVLLVVACFVPGDIYVYTGDVANMKASGFHVREKNVYSLGKNIEKSDVFAISRH